MSAGRLSIGQQQRLCLARGLAVEPEIILGDEPTSALDPQSSRNVETQLQNLKKTIRFWSLPISCARPNVWPIMLLSFIWAS